MPRPRKASAKAPAKGDVTRRTRTFVVYLDKNVCGVAPEEMLVEVAPGEDADQVCADALATLISNELETGWNEATEEDLRRIGER